MPCTHDKAPGQSRCRECNAAYIREYRATVQPRRERVARKTGIEAFRLTVIDYFEQEWQARGEDLALNGRMVAEIVRYLEVVD